MPFAGPVCLSSTNADSKVVVRLPGFHSVDDGDHWAEQIGYESRGSFHGELRMLM